MEEELCWDLDEDLSDEGEYACHYSARHEEFADKSARQAEE